MDIQCQDFVDSLITISERLKKNKLIEEEFWAPEEPPLTILFGALGDGVAEEFDLVDAEVNQRVFSLIEEAMASSHAPLVTAVATGLIEAVVSSAAQKNDLLVRILSMMGKLSLHHAEVWLSPDKDRYR
jgi:hypothetical protein